MLVRKAADGLDLPRHSVCRHCSDEVFAAAGGQARPVSLPIHESCYGSEDPGPCVNFALMNLEFKCGICFEPFTAENGDPSC